MVADPFTKPLRNDLFIIHVKSLRLLCFINYISQWMFFDLNYIWVCIFTQFVSFLCSFLGLFIKIYQSGSDQSLTRVLASMPLSQGETRDSISFWKSAGMIRKSFVSRAIWYFSTTYYGLSIHSEVVSESFWILVQVLCVPGRHLYKRSIEEKISFSARSIPQHTQNRPWVWPVMWF